MTLIYQYGFGVMLFGIGGFGGFDELQNTTVFDGSDAPIIAYQNEFEAGSGYNITVGSESSVSPLSLAFDADLLTTAEVNSALGVDYSTNNVALYSENLDNSYWRSGSSVHVLVVANDDGIAEKFYVNTWPGGVAQSVAIHAGGVTAAIDASFCFEVKMGVGQYIQLAVLYNSGGLVALRVNFDLINKVSIVRINTQMLVETKISVLTDGYLRCTVVVKNQSLLSLNMDLLLCDSTGSAAGNTSGMYCWLRKIQVAENYVSEPPYIQTASAKAEYVQYNQEKNLFQFIWNPAYMGTPRGFGVGGFGEFGFGGYVPAAVSVDCLIFGASRHDSAGYRSLPKRVLMFAESGFGQGGFGEGGFGGSVLDSLATSAENASLILQFQKVDAIRVTFSLFGLPDTAQIPYLFLGAGIHMPYIDMGFDPYQEVTYGMSFLAESGREYPQLRYRRMELSPRWSFVPKDSWAQLTNFREQSVELRGIFWFAWSPKSSPSECYLMREDSKPLLFPYVSASYRSLSPKLVEAL